MLLYRFIRRCRRRPQYCSRVIFWTTFQISFIFGRIDGPDLEITWLDYGRDLDLELSRSNIELAISRPKMVPLPRNKKQTYRLNSEPPIRSSDLTLAVTLTLNFQGKIWISVYLDRKWSDCLKEQTCRMDSKPQLWPSDLTLAVTLTLNLQGQIWNYYILAKKLSDCHQTKSKHIDWTPCPKCDHRIWAWQWTWL